LRILAFPISLTTVNTLIGPFFAGATTLCIYFLTKAIVNDKAGLFASFLLSVIPGFSNFTYAG